MKENSYSILKTAPEVDTTEKQQKKTEARSEKAKPKEIKKKWDQNLYIASSFFQSKNADLDQLEAHLWLTNSGLKG